MSNLSNLKGPKLYPTAAKAFIADSTTALRSASTRKSYGSTLRSLQNDHPEFLVADFTEQVLIDWFTQANLAPGTVVKYQVVLRRFFEWATWKDLVAKDPTLGLKRRLQTRNRTTREAHWLSESQVGTLLRAAGSDTVRQRRDQLIIATGIFTGLRRNEIAGLRWGHVDLADRTITVRGKGDKPALVGIPDQLHELLTRQRWDAAAGLGRPVEVVDPVVQRFQRVTFLGDTGSDEIQAQWATSVGGTGVANVVRDLGGRIGIPTLAPHDLRRTFAGLLESKGVPIQNISKALRHNDVGTTQRYLEASPRKGVEAVADFRLSL